MDDAYTQAHTFGLLGHPLGHSFSPRIHEQLGSVPYELFDKEPHQIEAFFAERNFSGINVTIPYKIDAFHACDQVSTEAKYIGAVNTVVKKQDGTLHGFNTDYHGFLYVLRKLGVQVSGKRVLILGNGGAARPIRTALADVGATDVITVVRNIQSALDAGELREDELATFEQAARMSAALVVNATPVGMSPHAPANVLDLTILAEQGLQGVIDIVYNPARTGIIMQAERLGIPTINGLGMLVAQAAHASAHFLGGPVVSDERIEDICGDISAQTLNIAFIGMPGSGKSVLAKQLAQRMNRPFVDIDAEIEHDADMSIPEIFEREGESGFRERELRILQAFAVQNGLVISCGGGIVETPDAYEVLHQQSVIVRVVRSLDKLTSKGRPLSQKHGIETLALRREPAYSAWADIVLENETTIDDAIDALYEMIQAPLRSAAAPFVCDKEDNA